MTIVTSLQIDEALRLTPFAPEDVPEAHGDVNARLWIDLQSDETPEVEAWLDELAVTGLSRRLCLEARDRPGFYPLKREVVLVIPIFTDAESSGEIDFLTFVCRENLLLTLHNKPLPQLADTEDAESWLSERSTAGLVAAAMIDVSLAAVSRTEDLRSAVLALEQRMDRDPDMIEADEILDIRAEVMELASMVSDQLPPLQAYNASDRAFSGVRDAREYMNCALVGLRAADGSLTSLDARVGALRGGFQMHAQDKTNRRLGMLTILSAIFMPITLLAGIWGMNFEVMPELKVAYAYPVALGFMVIVGAAMYLFFRRTGWFD
jgi:magnesium transporter